MSLLSHPPAGSTSYLQEAYFGGGCFWCTEAVFSRLRGVLSVTSGYAGGTVANPSYYQVSEGKTGHAEVIKIVFDPSQITYEQLLDVFFHAHDPTTLNQQGADVGPEYRSLILYTSNEQLTQATELKKKLAQTEFEQPLVTEIKPFTSFYPAEEYHQKFFENNETQPYCQVVIVPKLEQFQRRYHQLLKK